MQYYVGTCQDNYITRVVQSLSRLTEYYASRQDSVLFKNWDKSHQSAYLRFVEREFDDCNDSEDSEDLGRAIKAARLFKKQKVTKRSAGSCSLYNLSLGFGK